MIKKFTSGQPPNPAMKRARNLGVIFVWLLAVLGGTVPARARGETAACDGAGRIIALRCDGDFVPITTDVRVFLPGWSRCGNMSPWSVEKVRFSEGSDRREWTGRIIIDKDQACRYRQTIHETADQIQLEIALTAETDLDLQEVQFLLQLPVTGFNGRTCELRAGVTSSVAHASLPTTLPAEPHFLSGQADRVIVGSADRSRIELTFEGLRSITVQDERQWKGDSYCIYTPVAVGRLTKGATVSLRAKLHIMGPSDHSPAHLSLDTRRTRYRFAGCGGNFVYGIDSPIGAYNLDHLRVAWARTELSAHEWEPVHDNNSPTNTHGKAVAARDRPGSDLHSEFLLAQDLARRGIPCCISVWHLPEWLYADPGQDMEVHRRRIAPAKWPELLDCLGSYLLHAKRQYGFEPELFSFNEADEGVCVLLSAEEHRDAIRRIGAHFQRLGLKTKMLLGDGGDFRHGLPYVVPATADPEAMRYVGALAFHSWGGGTAAEYSAWADLADRIKLPLLVTELGLDSRAYRTASYIQTPYYAIQELRMYQEILLHARPTAILEWELSADYPLVQAARLPGGAWKFTPTLRSGFLKHFANLTPAQASALVTTSDQTNVLFTAFVSTDHNAPVYTLHIANPAAGRTATITGLPPGIHQLFAVRTSETDSFRVLDLIPVRWGKVNLSLTPQSLLTLTTAILP